MSTTRKMVILLGAPLVVVAGLGIYLAVEKGSALVQTVEGWARELEHSPTPVAMQVGGLPVISQMHVDGERIGRLQTVVVLRDQPGAVDSLLLVVSADPGVSLGRFASCRLLMDPHALEGAWPLEGIKHVLRCTTDTTGLVPFGRVVFPAAGNDAELYIEKGDLPCDNMSDPTVEPCTDIRIKMRRLRDELRREIRTEVRNEGIRVTIQR